VRSIRHSAALAEVPLMRKPAGRLPVLRPELGLKRLVELQKKNRLGWSIAPPVETAPEAHLAQRVNLEARRLEGTTKSRPECRRTLAVWLLAQA